MQCIVPLRIRNRGVGIVRNEEMDNIQITIPSRPLHGRSDEVSAQRIDLCALFQQVPTCSDMGIDRGPVEWCYILLVPVSCGGLA